MDDSDRQALRDELAALRADLCRVGAAGDRSESTVAELAAVVGSLIQIFANCAVIVNTRYAY